ncbi:MAG: polyprenyl synthetase family protein [Pelosinus sp.]|nr:polyprenyl synthetase family protein [Pelosinus sp.]
MFHIVKNELATFEEELYSVIYSPISLLEDVGDHLQQAGGKRLRPALYLICAKSCTNKAALMPMATAIEMLHMATLVHDDVIDNAATRRGISTANIRWGNHVAVLAGDYLFAKAFSSIANHVNCSMLQVLTDVIGSLCEGEIEQFKYCFNPAVTEEQYLRRIAKKTADLIAASCELGGISAGFKDEEVAALKRYGYCIGLAFQITDDLLDITASAVQVGKPVGNDLGQGIVTMPAIYALQNSAHKAELAEIIDKPEISAEEIQRGLAIINECGAVEYSCRQVERYLEEAKSVLPACLSPEVKETLINIAEYIGRRDY